MRTILFVVILFLFAVSARAGKSYQDLRETAEKFKPAIFSNTEYLFNEEGFLYVNFAPDDIRGCLDYADRKFNNNQMIDCMDEAWEAAAYFLSHNRDAKERFGKLMDVLSRGGYDLLFMNSFRYFDCGLLLPRVEFDHGMEDDADHDEYFERRSELTDMIIDLDSAVHEMYADLERFREEGKLLTAKMKDKAKENSHFAYMISREKDRGAHKADTRSMRFTKPFFEASVLDSLDDIAFRESTLFTIKENLDMDLLADMFQYIIRGRELMRKGLFIDYRTAQLKSFDEELDDIGLELVDMDEIRMEQPFAWEGTVAGYLPQEQHRKELLEELARTGVISDSLMNSLDNLTAEDSTMIREINDRILEIYKMREANNEEISRLNNDITQYNEWANSYMSRGNQLFNEIATNNKKIDKLKAREEQLEYEWQELMNKEWTMQTFVSQFEHRKRVWNYYIDVVKTKQKSWEYYMYSVEHWENSSELLKRDSELTRRVEEVREKQETLHELHEELIDKREELEDRFHR
ncbi:MAG: hypothetical protein ACLFQX_06050 [Candidatus Kapaibacterium sp.]